MCLYFLIRAFLYNYYKTWGQLMKFMLSKTYKNGFWTREISNKSTKKCRWENTTVTTVTSSFKTLISPENAIFKASNTFEPRLFGTILSMVSTPTPPPPLFFLFLIIFIKYAWIYNIILFLACAFLIAETNQTYLDGFPKGVCSRFVKTVLFFFGENYPLCCFLFSFCWINCASYGIWFEGFLPIWWFL